MDCTEKQHAGKGAGMKTGIISVICIFLASIGQSALAFSCDGKIVSVGDTKAEVFMKCGEPAWKESREEEIIEKIDEVAKRKTIVAIDEWAYNFGPQSFIRVLEFRSGKLAAVREAGYGYADSKERGGSCDEQKIERGAMKLDVLVKCGEPSWKEERTEEVFEEVDKNTKRKVTVTYEDWTYNLGPNRFMRILTFKNGRLVDIRTGSYGN